MATGRPSVTVEMRADDRDLNRDLRGAETAMKGFSLTGGRMFMSMNTAVRTLTGSIRGMVDSLMEARSMYSTQIQAERNLAATLESTGNKVGFTTQQLKDFAAELQSITAIGDEVTIKAMAQLATFTSITGQEFKRAIMAAQDLSKKLDQDLKSSVMMLGKALQDPIRALGSLAEAGITVTKQQKELITSLWEMNRTAEAQAVILALVEEQVSGTAAAMYSDIEAMRGSIGDLMEDIGHLVNSAIRPWVREMKNLSDELNKTDIEMQAMASSVEGYSRIFLEEVKIIGRMAGFMTDIAGRMPGPMGDIPRFIGDLFGEAGEAGRDLATAENLSSLLDRELAQARIQEESKAKREEELAAANRAAASARMFEAMNEASKQAEDEARARREYEIRVRSAMTDPMTGGGVMVPMFELAKEQLDAGFQASLDSLTGLSSRITTAAASIPPEERKFEEDAAEARDTMIDNDEMMLTVLRSIDGHVAGGARFGE